VKILRDLAKKEIIPPHKLLELYPPFLFMGVKIPEVSKDNRKLRATMPLRWYARNIHGTMFGGFMCALADPLPALMCARIFPNLEVWTKACCVEFIRPAKGLLILDIEITEQDVAIIGKELDEKGKITYAFEFSFRDKKGEEIAKVKNTVFLRKLKPRKSTPKPNVT